MDNKGADRYIINKRDTEGLYQSAPSMIPGGRMPSNRVESTDSDDLEALREEESYGIFPTNSLDSARSCRQERQGYSELKVATTSTVEGNSEMTTMSSINAFKKISPAWIFSGPSALVVANNVDETTHSPLPATPQTPISMESNSTRSRVPCDPPSNHMAISRFSFRDGSKPVRERLPDGEPPVIASLPSFESYPPMDDDSLDQTPSNRPEWTQKETSCLSFGATTTNRAPASDESCSSVQSWISADRVIRSSPSFPPTTSIQAVPPGSFHDSARMVSIPLGADPVYPSPTSADKSARLSVRFKRPFASLRHLRKGDRSVPLPRPPPPQKRHYDLSPTGSDRFDDEGVTTSSDSSSNEEEQLRRMRLWDKAVFLAFLLAAVLVGVTVAVKVLGPHNKATAAEQKWVRVGTPEPTLSGWDFGTLSPNTAQPIPSSEGQSAGAVESAPNEGQSAAAVEDTDDTIAEHVLEYEAGDAVEANSSFGITSWPAELKLPLPDYTRMAIDMDANSPQAAAYRWVLSDPNLETYPEWRRLQRFALVTLFFATQGHLWSLSNSWLVYGISECHWYSNARWENNVVCDTEDRYWSLMLANNELQGSLPPELELLKGLQQLDVRSNLLQGELPSTMSQLTNLKRLDFAENMFTGSIPSAWGAMTSVNLLALDLSSNNLTHTIPTELAQLVSIQNLNLGNNFLQGPLPTEFGSLTGLQQLVLENNMLNNTIPVHLGRLTNLSILRLGSNEVRFRKRLPYTDVR
jgi:hypothetical protein